MKDNPPADYFFDRGDEESRRKLGKEAKKLSGKVRKELAKDPKFTDKRKNNDKN